MALGEIPDRLSKLTAEDLMSRDVLTLTREASVQDALMSFDIQDRQ